MEQESSGIELVYVCVCEGGVGRFGFAYTPLTHGFILLHSIFYFSILYILYFYILWGHGANKPPPSFLSAFFGTFLVNFKLATFFRHLTGKSSFLNDGLGLKYFSD